jgi:hypothetical protein
MLAGAKSLAEVEGLSTRMSTPVRRLFGIQRRVPDTTLRDALCWGRAGARRAPPIKDAFGSACATYAAR